MAKLLIYESVGIREFELMDEEVRIGRELDNTLRIPDPSVSRHHAVLRRTPQGYVIQDKQSANGIVMWGKKVEEVLLSDGDEFSLGQVQITFQSHDNIKNAVTPATPDDAGEAGRVAQMESARLQGQSERNSASALGASSFESSRQTPERHESKTTDPCKESVYGSTTNQGGDTMSQQDSSQKMIRKPEANPILALLISIFVYNAGHVYNDQTTKWSVTTLFIVIGSILCLLPGLFIWVLSVIDSYQTAQRLNSGESIPENEYSFSLLYKIIQILDKSATCSRT